MENKVELSQESKDTLKSCWLMTTEHSLDEENIKIKEAIAEVLEKSMTRKEKSEWGYEYYIKQKQYNDDLEHNKKLLQDWANILKGMGNRNYPYVYAINRVLKELGKLNEHKN